MDTPLISVIVPVYNVERYINRCIESIVNQTYQNLEIIIIDDGSHDNCPKICDEWEQQDNRIKVVHKLNGGVSSARNAGLNICSGAFITFVDSDDWIDLDTIEDAVYTAKKNEADVICYDFYFEYLDSETLKLKTKPVVLLGNEILEKYIFDEIRPEVSNKLYASSVIDDLRFNIEEGYGEDVAFNYNVLKNAKALINMGVCKYHYLQNSGSSSTTPFITESRAKSYKVFENILIDCEKDDNLHNAAVWRFTVATFAILSRVLFDISITDKYYNDIADAFRRYKSEIIKCKLVSKRHKMMVIMISINKLAFKKFVKLVR